MSYVRRPLTRRRSGNRSAIRPTPPRRASAITNVPGRPLRPTFAVSIDDTSRPFTAMVRPPSFPPAPTASQSWGDTGPVSTPGSVATVESLWAAPGVAVAFGRAALSGVGVVLVAVAPAPPPPPPPPFEDEVLAAMARLRTSRQSEYSSASVGN